MTRRPSPPRLARTLASLALRGDTREVVVGDLDQEFSESIADGIAPTVARSTYWRQTFASIGAVWRGRRQRRPLTIGGFMGLFRGLSLDLSSVLRVLRRSPGYAAIAVISLAIGIGANTAMFSVVRQMLLMPLPVEQPRDLRLVYWTPRHDGPLGIMNIASSSFSDAAGTNYRSNFNYPQFVAMRRAVSGSADLAAYNFLRRLTASAEGRPPIVTSGMLASGNFFSTVRPPFALGRGLTNADDAADAPEVAVISYGLWTRLFDGDPHVLGRSLRINDVSVEIVGVTAAGYRGLSQTGVAPSVDVTIALAKQPVFSPAWSVRGASLFADPKFFWIRLIARTKGGPDEATSASLQATLAGMLVDGGIKPDIAAKSAVGVFPGTRGLDSLRRASLVPLRILTTIAAVVLFIACLNVAGLMLARGVSRQRELAVRRALGAGRLRIIRELLLESVILSVVGALTGLLVALWAAPALQSMLSAGLGTSGVTVTLDWTLIGATAAIAAIAGILAGLLPAIRFSRAGDATLKDRSRAAGAPKLLVGRALLALQIAISLPLVAGAELFLRTLHNLGNIDLGFNPRDLALFTIDPTMNGKAPERNATIFPRLLDRLEAIPGVTSATLLENALISGSSSNTDVTIDGRNVDLYMNSVGPHYLETMGMRLVAGRSILASDSARVEPVAVINETALKKYLAGQSPLGARISSDLFGASRGGARNIEVIGVVADSKYDDLRSGVEPTMLNSYLQRPVGSMNVAVRSSLPAPALFTAIQTAIHDVDPSLPMADFKTQQEQIDLTIGRERTFTRLLTVFGGFALLLACVGLHGITSYSVARRTPEIGIRLALGAQRSGVLWLVLRQVLILAAAGLALGLPIAWLTGPVANGFLFELDSRDPATLVIAAAIMTGVAALAGFWPARRAAKMEALTALRME